MVWFVGLVFLLSVDHSLAHVLPSHLINKADPDEAAGGGERAPSPRSFSTFAAAAASPSSSLASPASAQPSQSQPPQELSESVVAQLIPRVRGLVRLCRLSKVMERYRGRLTDTLKGVIKTALLEYLDMAEYQQQDLLGDEELDAASGSGSGSGGNGKATGGPSTNAVTSGVKAMPAGDFLDCLRLCFEQMLLPMERAALVHAFLEEQISVEMSHLLDRRAARSGPATVLPSSPSESEPPSPSPLPLPPLTPPSPAAAAAGAGAVPVPPPSPPPKGPPTSKSDKFKNFLDKRRMETQGSSGPAAGAQAGGGGGGGGTGGVGGGGGGGAGGGGGRQGSSLRDEEQIKLLELQACKRLNDEILKTLCDLCQRHVASLLGMTLSKTQSWLLSLFICLLIPCPFF